TNWFGRVILCILIGVSFIPPVWILIEYLDNPRPSAFSPWREWKFSINIWVRIAGTIVACLTLLGVAVRASGSITGARERQTVDRWLITAMDRDEMLWGKWMGAIWSVRWGWLWLGLIWGTGVVTGGLHVLAAPLLATAWFVFAAFLAVLGLWFSAVSHTTLRGTVTTLGAVI